MLQKWNQRGFHRRLYGGQLKTVLLLKRLVDQQEGGVTALTVYQARRSNISKTGQSLQNDMSTNHTTTWQLPRSELDRLGVTDINVLDRIIENSTQPTQVRWWQPETHDRIDIKLFENEVVFTARRIDPPIPLNQVTVIP